MRLTTKATPYITKLTQDGMFLRGAFGNCQSLVVGVSDNLFLSFAAVLAALVSLPESFVAVPHRRLPNCIPFCENVAFKPLLTSSLLGTSSALTIRRKFDEVF